MGGGAMGGGAMGGGMGSQSFGGPQQGMTGSARPNLNDPATALANTDNLDLTSDQVQRLQKMARSGSKHAGLILTADQKKKLHQLVGTQRKARSSTKATAQGQ
jgi:hypothetical protein